MLPMVIAPIAADEGMPLGGNILEVVEGISRGIIVAIADTPIAEVDFTGSGVIKFEPRIRVMMIVEQRLDIVGYQFVEHQIRSRTFDVRFEPSRYYLGEDGVEDMVGMPCRVGPRMNAIGTVHLIISDVSLFIGPTGIEIGAVCVV